MSIKGIFLVYFIASLFLCPKITLANTINNTLNFKDSTSKAAFIKPTAKKLNFWQKLQQKIVLKKLKKVLYKTINDNTTTESKRAKAAFILGLCTLPGVLIIGGLAFITAIVAIILGAIALKDIAKSNGKLTGTKKAWTGIILGGVFLLVGALAVAVIIASIGQGGWIR